MKTIGIAAHSSEGGALCFLTACHAGAEQLGAHMHPDIVLSAVPMGLSMPAWEADDQEAVAQHLIRGVQIVADAGANFYVCPDNTAHIVLEKVAGRMPIPGLHIGRVVCREIERNGWTRVGLLGTKWTMTGPVYERALAAHSMERLVPDKSMRLELNAAIFDELCQGRFTDATTKLFQHAIDGLKDQGAECVILGCTEIPLIINDENSALPVLDSTRLLARHAVAEALDDHAIASEAGWISAQGRYSS
ncbi:MAG: aspartate/glutamate racemase family protein [Phycisphaerales bacterium]